MVLVVGAKPASQDRAGAWIRIGTSMEAVAPSPVTAFTVKESAPVYSGSRSWLPSLIGRVPTGV